MCHFIDNSDHWEHNDKSISTVNFLKFSDSVARLLCSGHPRNYQNRMRHFEYIKLLEASGFTIDRDESEVDKNALRDLKHIDVCKRYRDTPHEQLAVLRSYVVASR